MVITRVNGPGIHIEYGAKLKEMTLYPEGSSVHLYVTVKDGKEIEALMYLSPEEAMKIAKALEASAIEALKYVSA